MSYSCRSVVTGIVLKARTLDELGELCLADCIRAGISSFKFDLFGDAGHIRVRTVTAIGRRGKFRVCDRVSFPRGNTRTRRLCVEQLDRGERSERERARERCIGVTA